MDGISSEEQRKELVSSILVSCFNKSVVVHTAKRKYNGELRAADTYCLMLVDKEVNVSWVLPLTTIESIQVGVDTYVVEMQ
jgi:hypothetical protein